jgi:hypothetical protein
MKALRLLSLMAVCCATGTMTEVAWAAEPAAAKPTTPGAAQPKPPADESAAPKTGEPSSAAQPSSDAKGTQSEEDAEAQQAVTPKPKASGKGGSPERFVPSEQVRADFDVSFPIDI